jgi:pyridoxine/pyridoxamine 5'-phosphate oxidase
MQWPDEIYNLAKTTFGSETFSAYGQLSTVNDEGQPSVRTVHIHLIDHPTQGLLISTNIKSEKWTDIKKNPRVAGCFWNPDNNIQIRFQGIADLITEKNSDFKDLVHSMWKKIRPEVRLTYHLDEQGIPFDTKNPTQDPDQYSKNYGLVLITPTLWDIFENNSENYRLGKRWIYRLKNNKWKWREANSLHEK